MDRQQRPGTGIAGNNAARVVLLADALDQGITPYIQLRQALQSARSIARPGALSLVTAAPDGEARCRELLLDLPGPRVFRQPCDRGTGVAVLVPLLQDGRRAGSARVVVLTPAGAVAYGSELVGAVHQALDELESSGSPVRVLCAEPGQGRLVLVAEAGALLTRFRGRCPEALAMLDSAPAVAAWRDERGFPELERLYALLPDVDLCRDILDGSGLQSPRRQAGGTTGAASPLQLQLTGDGY